LVPQSFTIIIGAKIWDSHSMLTQTVTHFLAMVGVGWGSKSPSNIPLFAVTNIHDSRGVGGGA